MVRGPVLWCACGLVCCLVFLAGCGGLTSGPTAGNASSAVNTSSGTNPGAANTSNKISGGAPAVLAPTISSLTASPTTVNKGGFTTLSWRTENATSVAISPGSEREDGQPLPISGRTTQVPPATTTYTLTATGPGGTASAIVTVSVTVPPPGVTMSVTPQSVVAGESATLTWASENATSVTIDNGIGTVAPVGSTTIYPTASTTFTASATSPSGATTTSNADITLVLSRPARPARPTGSGGSLSNIKHIIFFVQENRSFDNYFGMLGAYRVGQGLPNEIDGLDSPNVQAQPDQNGVLVAPYHQQTVCAENTSPSWNPSWHGYNDGAMDGFVSAHNLPTTLDEQYHRVMAYYDQRELPYYYELATQFATSDRWFASVMAGTIPNRMYLFGATSAGHVFPDPPPSGGFPIRTIFENLRDAGVSWRYYYMDNSIFLSQFEAWNDPAIQSNVYNISDYYSTLADPNADDLLPSVIFIERGSDTGLDEHPDNNTQTGAAVGAQIINALLASPAWGSSVFIHTYDEFGGLYDHVPIIPAPAPDNIQPIATPGYEALLPGDFAHSDFRVPLIVISPWAKPNLVSHTPRELTSILKLIETRFNLPSLTPRDAWADNMLEFFDFSYPHLLTPPSLPAQPTNGTCDFNLELAGQN